MSLVIDALSVSSSCACWATFAPTKVPVAPIGMVGAGIVVAAGMTGAGAGA